MLWGGRGSGGLVAAALRLFAFAVFFAAGRAEFVGGELAVAVFIESFEGGGSVGDFVGVDHAVVIRVEEMQQWMRRAPLAVGGLAGGAGLRVCWNLPRRKATRL